MINPEKIKSKAGELGFTACRIAKSEPLDLGNKYDYWLSGNFHGTMAYLEKNIEKRLDPSKLFPGTKSIIVLAAAYYSKNYNPQGKLKISRYASGRDYHRVLKKMGQKLIDWIEGEYGENNSRVFVDSAPVMEKEWARRAGLGWQGRNTCLIIPGKGSWFFLGVILTDLEIKADEPETRNLCGNCTKCVDACPTNAIRKEGFVDARKCISYLTIEYDGRIPNDYRGKTDDWLFGCDICQDVCPYNRFAVSTSITDFEPRQITSCLNPDLIKNMDQDDFNKQFPGSPLRRAGLEKLKTTTSFLFPDL